MTSTPVPVPAPSRSSLPALPVDDMYQDAHSWKCPFFNSIRFRAILCLLSPSPKAPSQRPNPVTASLEQPQIPRCPERTSCCVSSLTAASHTPTCSATGVSLVAFGDTGTRSSPCSAKRSSEGLLTPFLLADHCTLLCPEALGISSRTYRSLRNSPQLHIVVLAHPHQREHPRHQPEAPNQ